MLQDPALLVWDSFTLSRLPHSDLPENRGAVVLPGNQWPPLDLLLPLQDFEGLHTALVMLTLHPQLLELQVQHLQVHTGLFLCCTPAKFTVQLWNETKTCLCPYPPSTPRMKSGMQSGELL